MREVKFKQNDNEITGTVDESQEVLVTIRQGEALPIALRYLEPVSKELDALRSRNWFLISVMRDAGAELSRTADSFSPGPSQ